MIDTRNLNVTFYTPISGKTNVSCSYCIFSSIIPNFGTKGKHES